MERNRWLLISAAVLIALSSVTTVIVLVVTLGRTTYDRCNQFDAPPFLYITERPEDIVVSWNHQWPNEECGVSYKLQHTLNEGQENVVYVSGRTYNFPRPNVCSSLYFRLWAINQAGELSNSSATEIYREIPTEADISDIAFLPSDEGLVVTWTRPTGLDDCTIFYDIQYSSDVKRLARYNGTYTESFLVPDTDYCFYVFFYVNVHVFDRFVSGDSEMYHNFAGVTNIQVMQSPENFTEMTVFWDKHLRHDACSITYEIQYHIEGIEEVEVRAEYGFSTTFTAHFCSVFAIVIKANSPRSSTSVSSVSEAETLSPTGISDLTDLIHLQEEGKQVISWRSTQNLDNCEVNYNLDLSTDLDEFSFVTNETSFEVPYDTYCSSLEFQVEAVVGSYSSKPVQSDLFAIDLEEPQDVELTSLPAENTLVASWRKHDKQDLCYIEYKVLYEYANFSQIFRTREPSINLDIAYCTLATVQVSTVRGSDESNAVMANHKEEQPDALGPIQNPKVDVTEENEAIISWNPPEHASQCTDLEYIVNARNEETEENERCTGKITCSLSLSSFCPATTFIVREISDITQENSFRHIC